MSYIPPVAQADASAFTSGTSLIVPAGGSDGTTARAFATDANGKQRVLLYDAAGNAITSTSSALDVNIKSGNVNPLYSGSVTHPLMVANYIANVNISGTGSVAIIVGSPGYFIQSIRISNTNAVYTAGALMYPTLSDSSSGSIFLAQFLVGGAATVAAGVVATASVSSPPGFFWNNKVANSTLSVALNVALTSGQFYVSITYGICSFVG